MNEILRKLSRLPESLDKRSDDFFRGRQVKGKYFTNGRAYIALFFALAFMSLTMGSVFHASNGRWQTAQWLVIVLLLIIPLYVAFVKFSSLWLATYLLVIGLFVGIFGYINQHPGEFIFSQFIEDFYANGSSELISIAFTVLLIDSLNNWRQEEKLRQQFIGELRSDDRSTVLKAIKELKARRWFYDGSLAGEKLTQADISEVQLREVDFQSADLRYTNFEHTELRSANLKHALLNGANFEYCDLSNANLSDADLRNANLKGAHITLKQLESVAKLDEAIMPDGTRFEQWRIKPREERERELAQIGEQLHAQILQLSAPQPQKIETQGGQKKAIVIESMLTGGMIAIISSVITFLLVRLRHPK